MEIKTKFNFGDMVVPIKLTETKKTVSCSGCEETGTIVLKNGKEHCCPVCNGSGKVRIVTGKQWSPVHALFGSTFFKVTQIAMLQKIASGEESYLLSNEYYGAEDVFSNEEDAVKECERRNTRLHELGFNL